MLEVLIMSTVLVAVSPLSICMKLMLVVLSCTTGPAIQRRVPVSEQLYLYTSNRSSAWVRHRDVCLCQAQPGSGTETCACVKHSLGQAQRRVPVSSTARVRHRDVCLCQTDYTFIPAPAGQCAIASQREVLHVSD